MWGVLLAASLVLLASDPVSAELVRGMHEGVPWPIVEPPAPLPFARAQVVLGEPATPAADRVLAELETIRRGLRERRYQARTDARPREGVYRWDCSGMAAWVLGRTAPRARAALTRARPVARDFAALVARSPTEHARQGWQRVARVQDVRPGDVFAWRRPRGFPSAMTGHVGFVVATPAPVPGVPSAFEVRIVDSTRWPHQDDTRREGDGGGFGTGTIVVLTDDSGHATSYGWHGTRSPAYVVTDVFFGRVHG